MGRVFVSLYGFKDVRIVVYGCHNPESWNFNGGKEIEYNDLLNQILDAIKDNGIVRNFSILGGEPLCKENRNLVLNILKEIRKRYPNIIIYCWTGGLFETITKYPETLAILKYIDILIDGQFILEKRDITLKLRGSTNQRIIDVQESLKQSKVIEIS